ncbi:MAG: hypothetical protein KBD78_14480 [Oligoflexales bacterium]|nr:hypothetical protein [Oligoflexales bacterium]
MKKVLISCFEPFGRFETNFSHKIALHLSQSLGKINIESDVLILPVNYSALNESYFDSKLLNQYSLVLMLGISNQVSSPSFEYFAHNIDYSPHAPDNSGELRNFQTITPSKELTLTCTLPIKEISEQLNSLQLIHTVSFSAGAYLCNHAYFRMLEKNRAENSPKIGFVHVPTSSHQIQVNIISKTLEVAITTSFKLN